MKIVISGTAASGKSSVAKLLSEKLGFRHFSMGDLQRDIAREKGISILELGRLEATDDKIDKMIDERQEKIGKDYDDFVIDGWLGSHFIPDSVKIFLDADLDVRAKRRIAHKRSEEAYDDIDLVKKEISERARVNRERWIRYYGFDYRDIKNYDKVIDTSHVTIEDIVEHILMYLQTENLYKRQNSEN